MFELTTAMQLSSVSTITQMLQTIVHSETRKAFDFYNQHIATMFITQYISEWHAYTHMASTVNFWIVLANSGVSNSFGGAGHTARYQSSGGPHCFRGQTYAFKCLLFSGQTISHAFIKHSFMNWPSVNGRDAFAIMLLMTKLAFTKSSLDLLLFVNKLRCCARTTSVAQVFSSRTLPDRASYCSRCSEL